MGCNCGRPAGAPPLVFNWHSPDGQVQEFTSEEDAKIARTRAGGKGPIIRRPKRRSS